MLASSRHHDTYQTNSDSEATMSRWDVGLIKCSLQNLIVEEGYSGCLGSNVMFWYVRGRRISYHSSTEPAVLPLCRDRYSNTAQTHARCCHLQARCGL